MIQKTERTINWSIYFIGFVISALIFGIGFWFGSQIETGVAEQLKRTIDITRGGVVSVETMLILENDSSFCEFFMDEMAKSDSETYELGKKIGYMEERKGVDPQLKADYMTLEFRDYLLSKRIDAKCNGNSTLVLYFLSSSSCPDCKSQGLELTKVRDQIPLRVYSFDMDINNSLVNSLSKSYEIERYPTLIINDKKYVGYLSSQDILKAINQ